MAFTTRLTGEQAASKAEVSLMIDRLQIGSAPTFTIGQIPDPTEPGWDIGLRNYWDTQ
jgi:hypothetical protein